VLQAARKDARVMVPRGKRARPEQGATMSTENKQPQSELINELNKLGENLGNLLRSAWESEERKSVEREIAAGLEQMSKKINETAEQLKTDANVHTAKRAVKGAWETAHGPQIVTEFRQGVLDTIKRINDELAKRSAPAQEATAETVSGEGKPE
jgi:ElaB/YqjD/DUF883 family membrane-anchored ribosome-binding protein